MSEKRTERYIVTGMSCAACSARVEKCVSSLTGVDSCSVNLLTGDLTVCQTAEQGEVIRAVESAGYGCRIKADHIKITEHGKNLPVQTDIHRETEKNLRRTLILSLIFLLPLVYLSMGVVMRGFPAPSFVSGNPIAIAVTEMLLASAVLILNRRFFINGWKGVLHLSPNMDTLVSLGSGISWLWSTAMLFSICAVFSSEAGATELPKTWDILHSMYYESAAMILVLISVGKLLEERAKGKTTDAIRSLACLQPETATVLTAEGETEIPVGEIRPGDRFVLRPGAAVPADGIVLEGISVLDESMLTGESMPVEKRPAENESIIERTNRVFAATVNKTGRLICRAESTGDATMLSQIIRMVSDASASKAPAARIADRVAGIFVPSVLAVSMITFAVWLLSGADLKTALNYAVSVLVISCPCSLGLATPVAIMVGNGTGARNGILFKTSEALEQTGKAKSAVFDKTGTLTEGVFSLTDILPAGGVCKEELLIAAYSLEQPSEHPLAKAVVSYARENGIVSKEVTGFETTGSKVTGYAEGKVLTAGSRRSLSETGIPEEELQTFDLFAKKLAEQAKTPVYFASDGKFLGLLAFEDRLKEHAAEAVRELKEMGIVPVLLTGDHELAGKAVAERLGIEKVYAGVLPSEKADIVGQFKKDGAVLMIGDGINDAPALKAADIGLAVAGGTDIAVEACDVVLMKSDPLDVAAAVRLSKQTLKNIRQNLFWAFFYNALCIPLAAGVFARPFGISLSPMIGAVCMSLSSLFVVTNALRLNRAKIYLKNDSKNVREKNEMTEIIEIKGMMCRHCEARVKNALLAVPGVTDAQVSHEKGTAVVTGQFEREALIKAVREAGYEA